MGEQTDKEKLEAATKVAEAAKEAKAEPPAPHLALGYTGPLTCDQAQARHRLHGENLRKPVDDTNTKPAEVKATK